MICWETIRTRIYSTLGLKYAHTHRDTPQSKPTLCQPMGKTKRLIVLVVYIYILHIYVVSILIFLFAGCTTTEKPESHGNLYQCYFQMILQLHCTWEGNPISNDVLCQPRTSRKNSGSIARSIARGLEHIPWKTFNASIGWSLLLCTGTMFSAIRTARLAQYPWLVGRLTSLFWMAHSCGTFQYAHGQNIAVRSSHTRTLWNMSLWESVEWSTQSSFTNGHRADSPLSFMESLGIWNGSVISSACTSSMQINVVLLAVLSRTTQTLQWRSQTSDPRPVMLVPHLTWAVSTQYPQWFLHYLVHVRTSCPRPYAFPIAWHGQVIKWVRACLSLWIFILAPFPSTWYISWRAGTCLAACTQRFFGMEEAYRARREPA